MAGGSVAGALLLGACGHGLPADQGRLSVHGRVLVGRVGRPLAPVRGEVTLNPGDRVRVSDGTAELRVAGNTETLRGGTELHLAMATGLVAYLDHGDLLVESGRHRATVGTSVGNLTVSGAVRLRRDLALSVATYKGVSDVVSGIGLRLPALRQGSVAAIGVTRGPLPIALDPADQWDRRFLGAAIELNEELASISAGFTQDAADEPGGLAAALRNDMAGLASQPAFTDGLIAQTVSMSGTAGPAEATIASVSLPPGEALVGAGIALASPRGTFLDHWRAEFVLRGEGAEWGVVAVDQGAEPERLIALLRSALDAASLAFSETATTSPLQTALRSNRVGPARASGEPPTTGAAQRPAPSTGSTTTTTTQPSPISVPPVTVPRRNPPPADTAGSAGGDGGDPQLYSVLKTLGG